MAFWNHFLSRVPDRQCAINLSSACCVDWAHVWLDLVSDVFPRGRADSDDRGFVAAPPGVVASSDPGDAIARRTSVRAVLLTGAKFYVSPRVFARTDLRVSFTDQIDALRWGAGVGVDF